MRKRLDNAVRRTLWVPDHLWTQLIELAKLEDRTASSMLRHLIVEAWERRRKP